VCKTKTEEKVLNAGDSGVAMSIAEFSIGAKGDLFHFQSSEQHADSLTGTE